MIDHNHFICHFIFGGHLLNIPNIYQIKMGQLLSELSHFHQILLVQLPTWILREFRIQQNFIGRNLIQIIFIKPSFSLGHRVIKQVQISFSH